MSHQPLKPAGALCILCLLLGVFFNVEKSVEVFIYFLLMPLLGYPHFAFSGFT